MEHTALTGWENFYVIVGSSSAALIGLQFVVIVLSAEMRLGTSATTQAFATPTIVHFGAALFISAVLSAPWVTLSGPGIALGLTGVAGLIFVFAAMRAMRRQEHYHPVAEDWAWHAVLPVVAYAAVLVAAIVLVSRPTPDLFVVAGATLLLLFIGIHNAWDAVVYVAHRGRESSQE